MDAMMSVRVRKTVISLIAIYAMFCLTGCDTPKTEVLPMSDPVETTVDFGNECLNAVSAYTDFLLGKSAVTYNDSVIACDVLTEVGNHNRFALFDINRDGIPEMHVRTSRFFGSFTFRGGEMVLVYEGSPYDNLLNDGAVLYVREGGAPPHVSYQYRTFDGDFNIEDNIDFEKHDTDENEIYDGSDEYYYRSEKISFEEWFSLTDAWLTTGADAVQWFDYPSWLMGNRVSAQRTGDTADNRI
jgi:hypothetical protein